MGYRLEHPVCSAAGGRGEGVFHKGWWGTVQYTRCRCHEALDRAEEADLSQEFVVQAVVRGTGADPQTPPDGGFDLPDLLGLLSIQRQFLQQ